MPATIWTRDALMEAAKRAYPHLKPAFIEPMVDLYLAKPDVFAEIVKRDMKRSKKAPAPETRQSVFETAVRVGRAENEPQISSVSVDTEADADTDEAPQDLAGLAHC